MRLRLIHISAALAAAILLMIAFMAAGVALVSLIAAVLAAALIGWIAYRVARNALMRRRMATAVSHGRQTSVR
jgi:membrane protein implicated in regulation of membrane protease activity